MPCHPAQGQIRQKCPLNDVDILWSADNIANVLLIISNNCDRFFNGACFEALCMMYSPTAKVHYVQPW